jgi:hypothetical protein
VEHRVIADSAIIEERDYYSMGLEFEVRIFCYGKAGRALTFDLERLIAKRVCWN